MCHHKVIKKLMWKIGSGMKGLHKTIPSKRKGYNIQPGIKNTKRKLL